MSDKIRSVLSPKFGDEWDRIFMGAKQPEQLNSLPPMKEGFTPQSQLAPGMIFEWKNPNSKMLGRMLSKDRQFSAEEIEWAKKAIGDERPAQIDAGEYEDWR